MSALYRIAKMAVALIGWLLLASHEHAYAHEVRPALLQISELPNGHYDIVWKLPARGEFSIDLVPHIEGALLDRPPDLVDKTLTFELQTWRNVDAGANGLVGRKLWIEGLDSTITDVLVLVVPVDGETFRPILTSSKPAITLMRQRPGLAMSAYMRLGIMHILTGYDHLAFVLGLLLLVASRSMLVKAISAFTIAHSITLAATALDLVAFNPSLIEAMVALSILVIAVELIHAYNGRRTLMIRYPWGITFPFGLLHGSAFASGLAEIGLPQNAVLPSLLSFNVGVEVGQLLFAASVLVLGRGLGHIRWRLPRWTKWLPPYIIGSLSAFWFIDRMALVNQ